MKNLFSIFLLLSSMCFYAQEQSASDNSSDQVHNTVNIDIQPSFPGSFQNEFMKYFKQPLIEKDIEAKLYMTFIIEKDGQISNIICNRDPGYGLCEAAENAIKAIKTRWSPGTNDGVPVRVKYSLPIVLKIKTGEPKKED